MNQNFVRTLQIAKDTATTALSAGTIPDFDQLVAGDIVVTNPKTGTVITSITGVDEVIVSQKGVDTVYHSAPIRINDIKSSSKKAYAAPVQEKKAIGYNGKAGSLSFDRHCVCAAHGCKHGLDHGDQCFRFFFGTFPGHQP